MALLEPLHVDVLASLHCALQHHRLLLLHLLDDRPLPDDGGDLNVEGEVGVDLSVFVADNTLVEAGVLRSRILGEENYETETEPSEVNIVNLRLAG